MTMATATIKNTPGTLGYGVSLVNGIARYMPTPPRSCARVGRYDYSARGDLGRGLGTEGTKRGHGLVDVDGSLLDSCLGCGDATIGGTPVGEGTRCGSSRLAGDPLCGGPIASSRIGRILGGASLLLRFRQQGGDLAALGPGDPGSLGKPCLDVLALLDHRLLGSHPCGRGFGLGTCRADGGVCRGELVLTGPQHLGGMRTRSTCLRSLSLIACFSLYEKVVSGISLQKFNLRHVSSFLSLMSSVCWRAS